MTTKGYIVDLAGVEFNDSGSSSTSWIQAMPLGKYTHPFFGEIDVTPEKAKNLAASVENSVRQTDLDIDYDHKMHSGEAAGWIKKAEARENEGLWILVEWTSEARRKIKDKVYKYFSPEFAEEWTHPKTGATYKDVLFGGGITNRPFLKDILPLNLSELNLSVESVQQQAPNLVIDGDAIQKMADTNTTNTSTTNTPVFETPGQLSPLKLNISPGKQVHTESTPAHQGGGKMTAPKKFSEYSLEEQKKLAVALGLGEDATSASVEAVLKALTESGQVGQPGTPGEGEGTTQPKEQRLADEPLDETLLADVAKLVGDNPALKVLGEVIENQQKELNQTTRSLRFAEAQGKITKLNEVALQKRRAFPSVIEDELRDILIDAPKKFSDQVYALMMKIAQTGMVQLGELGRGQGTAAAGQSLDTRARQLMADDKSLTYADAVERVSASNPGLFENHRSSSYIDNN